MKKNVVFLVTILLGALSFSTKTMGQPDPKFPRNDYKLFQIPAGEVRITQPVAYYDDNGRIVVDFNLEDEFGNIYVAALDEQNNNCWILVGDSVQGVVTSLTRDDFRPGLGEYSATEYVKEGPPNIIGILYDISNSMKRFNIDVILQAIHDLIKYKKPGTRQDIVFYNSSLTRNLTSSSDPVTQMKEFENMVKPDFSGGTAINTAGIREVIYESRVDAPGNKAIIIVSDLKNNRFADSKKELVRIANENHVKIFVIGLGQYVRERYGEYLAMNTGGKYIDCYDPSKLMEAFDEILNHSLPIAKVDYQFRYNEPNNLPGPRFVKITLCPPNGYRDRATIPVVKRDLSKEVLSNVHFDFDSAVVKPEYILNIKALKDDINNFLQSHPLDTLYIDSHTDPIGDPEYNLWLSNRRGNAVKVVLYNIGVKDTSRIVSKGYGETRPYVVTAEDHKKYPFLPEGQLLDRNFIENDLRTEFQRKIAYELNRRTHIYFVLKLC